MKRLIIILIFITTLTSCSNKNCECIVAFKSEYTYPESEFNVVYLEMNGQTYCLKESHIEELLNLINDKRNYLDGDCGTTFKDGVFIFINKKNGNCEIVSKIQFGCNYGQLYFMPDNPNPSSMYGHLTLEASELLRKIVVDIIN